jgi:hypothetical protein
MQTRLRSKLTYSNVVSTICLFLLLGGGGFAIASSNTKTVTKVIKKLAPGLSVNHANSADSASSASIASNANHATNSDLLGGSPPSAFHDRCPAGTTMASARRQPLDR